MVDIHPHIRAHSGGAPNRVGCIVHPVDGQAGDGVVFADRRISHVSDHHLVIGLEIDAEVGPEVTVFVKPKRAAGNLCGIDGDRHLAIRGPLVTPYVISRRSHPELWVGNPPPGKGAVVVAIALFGVTI